MATIVGVPRETCFSPGRVDDDAAILRATTEALARRGWTVRIDASGTALGPTGVASDTGRARVLVDDDTAAVLAMCQSPEALRVLDEAAARVPVINHPAAIRNCYRTETIPRLQATDVRFPPTRLVATDSAVTGDLAPCWVKRGDVHAMAAGDVVFAADGGALHAHLAALATRGVTAAAVQAHVEGAVVKCYGVADGRFFRCYVDAAQPPADLDALWRAASAAATALGLEVFGGDLVVDARGSVTVIDVNDWPSFARCRDDAAAAIADYVHDRLTGRLATVSAAAESRPPLRA